MIVLPGGIFLFGFHLQKNVTGKERLLEDDGLATITMLGFITWQCGCDALPFTILHKLFLPPRFGMCYEPMPFCHIRSICYGLDDVK